MPTVSKSILINAPLAAVYDIDADVRRAPEYLPGVSSCEPAGRGSNGDRYRFVYRALGLSFYGEVEVLELVRPRLFRAALLGRIHGEQTNTYTAEGAAETRVSWVVDYEVKLGPFGGAVAKALEPFNARTLEQGLKNLKRLCECRDPARVETTAAALGMERS